MNDHELELPAGIADAELWRQRVRALLAAAGDEGLLVAELVDAIEANHDQRFDPRRVRRWLHADQEAGLVGESDDGMWRVLTAVAKGAEDYLRGLDPDTDSEVYVLGDQDDEEGTQ